MQNQNQKLELLEANYLDNDMEKTTNDAVMNGVHGPKHWLIRISSFGFLVAAVIFINLFGTKNSEISAKYYLYVTPPGLFFVIWAFIFSLQIAANLINLIKNVWTVREHILLAINNTLLILWTIVFDIGDDAAVFCSFLILAAVIPVCLLFWQKVG